MFRLFLTLLMVTATAAGGVFAQEPAAAGWTVNADESKVLFRGTQEGDAFEGHFPKFDATIILDPENLETASIRAVIDMSAIEAGDDDRNSSLPGREWFHVRKFPEAVFTSNMVIRNAEGIYEAVGTLQIKDVSQDVTLPFTLEIDGNTARAAGTLSLIRTDYNVGTGAFSKGNWVGLDVTVEVQIVATRTD